MSDVAASQLVSKMMQDDLFSQWLGITVLEIKEGYSKIKMVLREEMMNGLGIIHGGIVSGARYIHYVYQSHKARRCVTSRSKRTAQWSQYRALSHHHHQSTRRTGSSF